MAMASLLFSPLLLPKPTPLFRKKLPSSFSTFASPSFRPNTPSSTSCPVPPDQLPVNEYQTLSTSVPFSWAAADLPEYLSRLISVGAVFALFVGLPVAAFGTKVVADPDVDGLRWSVAAVSTGLVAVTMAVLRMYLGWSYVGNRLLSATVEYEETGWYDGQIWVKTPEVLARDRLLGSFSVKPPGEDYINWSGCGSGHMCYCLRQHRKPKGSV